MPHFDIVKKNDPDVTFRVSKIQADFDVKLEHSNERFVGDIEMPNDWQIGVIVGASGTGKSTIAKELFGEELINGFEYKAKSVVDDIPHILHENVVCSAHNKTAFYSFFVFLFNAWLRIIGNRFFALWFYLL
mgnify:CR=1 FL=1